MPIDPVLPHDLDDIYGGGANQSEMDDREERPIRQFIQRILCRLGFHHHVEEIDVSRRHCWDCGKIWEEYLYT